MTRYLRVFLFSIVFIVGALETAQARIYVLIDQPSEKRFPIAVTTWSGASGKDAQVAQDLERLLVRNLQIAGYFDILPPSSYLSDPTASAFSESEINFNLWQTIGAQALIKGNVAIDGKNVTVQWYLYDTQLGKQLVGKEYTFRRDDGYKAVHKFANEVVLALTGSRGIFETRIAAACGPTNARQIVTVYPDGTGKEQWTKTKGNNMSPDWSADNGKLVYTSYTKVRKHYYRPDLHLLDLGSGKSKPIFGRGSLSITPSFSPAGAIAFTNTVSGDSEIYTIDLNGNLLGRLTNSWTIDVSPTWSPDGSQLIFSSERAGRLHLFKMAQSGGNVERLTFVGYQNDQADWAPTGDKIAFTSRDKGRFDIFLMNPDGSKIQRLTNQEGDNENPSWSPDGRYLTFSSTRTGTSQMYIMGWDGANPQLVTTDTCVNPDWSGWEASAAAQ